VSTFASPDVGISERPDLLVVRTEVVNALGERSNSLLNLAAVGFLVTAA
jgi:hypothetical protein